MAIADRLFFAFLGFAIGALIGVACWWLYGLAHSLNYDGPEMDPLLKHWVSYTGGAFAAVGFLFRERIVDLVGGTLSAIFHFESNQAPAEGSGLIAALVFIAIVCAALWFLMHS